MLPEATTVIGYINTAIDYAVPLFEKNVGTINNLIKLLEKASASLDALLPKIKNLETYIQDTLLPVLEKSLKVAKAAEKVCPPVKKFLDDLGPTEEAVVTALHDIAAIVHVVSPALAAKINSFADSISSFYGNADEGLGYCVKWAPHCRR